MIMILKLGIVLLIVLKYVHMFLITSEWGSDILVLGVVPKMMRLCVQ